MDYASHNKKEIPEKSLNFWVQIVKRKFQIFETEFYEHINKQVINHL